MSPSNSNTNNTTQATTEETVEEKSTFSVDVNEAEISNTPTTAANLINGVSATTSPAY
jgi:hypothetical protein